MLLMKHAQDSRAQHWSNDNDRTKERYRAWDGRMVDGDSRLSSSATSTSLLLSLPFELRQKIFEYVFSAPAPGPFPPQKSSAPSRSFGQTGCRYALPSPRSSSSAASDRIGSSHSPGSNGYLNALFVCRQIHRETRLLPFQVNSINHPATFGSNISATKHFLDGLRPFQRSAIRKLEIHLLASVTEAWSLRSILRSIADVTEANSCRKRVGQDDGQEELQGVKDKKGRDKCLASDLRSLTVHIATRDLLLAQADSLAGLTHMLTTAPLPFSSTHSSPVAPCASWVAEGVAYLTSLRRLTIFVEMSTPVAKEVSAFERSRFEQGVKMSLPWIVEVNIQWRVRQHMIVGMGDHDWLHFFWVDDASTALAGQGQQPGNGEAVEDYTPRTVPKIGFPAFPGLPS